jgi:hypothetical protein
MTREALEQKARRIARRAGFVAKKSRLRANSIDNEGGFQIVDPYFKSTSLPPKTFSRFAKSTKA